LNNLPINVPISDMHFQQQFSSSPLPSCTLLA